MSRHFTVQAGYSTHYANTVTVEADTLEEALEKALEAANEDPDGWRSTDHVTDSFVDAVCQGADRDPWGEGALPVPDRFTERGEPPVVTLTGPVPARRRCRGLRRPGAPPLQVRCRHGHVGVVRSAASAGQQTARHRVRRTRRQTPGQGRGRQGRNSHSGQLIRSPAWRRPQSIHPERPSRAIRSRARPCPVAGRPGRGSVPIFRARPFSNRRPRP